MIKNNLLEILRTFTKEDLKKFNEFVNSPYHNKKAPVTKLWEVIKHYGPEFKNKNLHRELIWKNLFPEKDFNYGVMKNLIYELQKLSEKFLSLQNYENNIFAQEIDLLNSLQSKGLFPLFEKNLKNFKSLLNENPNEINSYYYNYLSEVLEQNYLTLRLKTKDPNFCDPGPMNSNLISFFLINFFSENYNFLHDSFLFNKPYDRENLEAVIRFFKNSPLKENEFILMNYYTLKTLTDKNDESSYIDLKKLLFKNYKKLNREKIYNFSMALVNFCNYKLMNGNDKYIKEQFDIYRLMIDSEHYNSGQDEFINPHMYVNAVSMAGNLKEFKWADIFVEKFKDRLQPTFRDQYYALANVALNIKKQNFDLAQRYLSGVKCMFEIDKINLKRFQIIIYYESGYYDELYSLIDSSKHFISNDVKINNSAKTIFGNFLNFILKLADVKSGRQNKKIDKYYLRSLKDEIQLKEVSNKLWLLEKIGELKS